MSKGSIIIRLIDIVLLLLFGFLVISEIEIASPIKLAQSEVKVKKEVDKEEILIIAITKDKQMLVEREELLIPDFVSLKKLIDIRHQIFEGLDREMRVRIRSEWNLPIKYTMRIANYCRENNIAVGMDVESIGAAK